MKIKFLDTISNADRTIVWKSGTEYPVVFEDENTYLLEKQNGISCGIDKSLMGKKYVVV